MKKKEPTNIARLKNDYTQAKTLQAHRERKQKRSMRRRLAVILFVGCLVIIGLTTKIWTSAQAISEMETEKAEAEVVLKKTETQQDYLNTQIKRLEDENYVAKLARSQYYLSKDNEIIFSLPEDNAAKVIEETNEKVETTEKD
ncbi:FtsB family cell division protein [Carnobacterium antarcticum]|uniref:Septum formation initiator family protein n=1 Tax=Carnobacterium antarcticum TaxID=2126436 RepID=A0ABW4NJT0_9LACT|nr:septum formation initiator family protein [Carnobacterium sp. CP1]ALV22470.1 Cell division protein DivIC, stabilizes FtsL against RasP cleavage [Carnobacterium sp. CP1]